MWRCTHPPVSDRDWSSGTSDLPGKTRCDQYFRLPRLHHATRYREDSDAGVGNADPLVTFGLFNGLRPSKCNNIPSYTFQVHQRFHHYGDQYLYTIHWEMPAGHHFPQLAGSDRPLAQLTLGSSTMESGLRGPMAVSGLKIPDLPGYHPCRRSGQPG